MRLFEWLDRVYCNGDWRFRFDSTVVRYLNRMFFDYLFIMIDTGND